MQPEQEQEIAHLRSLHLTPKQIARKLGLRVAEVTTVIQAQATQQGAIARADAGGLAPVAECVVNTSAARALLHLPGPETSEIVPDAEREDSEGFALVLVARQLGFDRFLVCSYLVDYWCLGVKDTVGPRKLNGTDYKQFLTMAYSGFPAGATTISQAQAQAIVFSAVDYAQNLGFEPHRNFRQTRSHLGEWDGQGQLQCGRDGKPFYMSGPYDDTARILQTLRQHVGADNFDFVVGLS